MTQTEDREEDLALEIRKVGDCFRNRLADEIIDDALDYINFAEYELALSILSEQLCEYDVKPTPEEFTRLQQLWDIFGYSDTRKTQLEKWLKP